jgi:hypothetical protein
MAKYPPQTDLHSNSFATSSVAAVADPDPDVFGPPGSGSGSISERSGSGSVSFYHQAKIVRKALIPAVF